MNALLLLILRYGEAKYLSAADGPMTERLNAFEEADRLLKAIVDELNGPTERGDR